MSHTLLWGATQGIWQGLEAGNPHGFLNIPVFSWIVNTSFGIPGEGCGCELGWRGWRDKGVHWVENGTAGINVKPWDGNAGPWSFILG